MATRLAPSDDTLSFEEFLEAYDGVHAEWVDGKVFVMSPNTTRHTRLLRLLNSVLQYYAEKKKLGEVFLPGMPMRTSERAGREPDVFFVRNERLDLVREGFFDGPADLAIEIISRESRSRDRGEKFREYEKGGVSEYWLIDPERKMAEAYRLGAGGTYEAVPLGDPPALRSEALPGAWIAVEWLWQDPLPEQWWVHKEWGLI
jgi:Uma2 family endonuclease